jgi:hypothetical protein
MTVNEIVHVAITPPANLDENLVSDVAAVISKSPADIRLILAGKIPRIIAHYQATQAVESIAQRLRDLGLTVIVCKDFELHQSAHSFKAQTLEFGDKEVLFRDSAGGEKKVGENSIFVILEGRIRTSADIETTNPTLKFSLTKTFLMGGIPMWSKSDKKSTVHTSKDEYFARIYDRESSDPVVEMFQQHMNYSFLGTKLETYSLNNFNTVVMKLREAFPQAIYDNRLVKYFMVNPYSSRPWKDIEINCKLIYLFHQRTIG